MIDLDSIFVVGLGCGFMLGMVSQLLVTLAADKISEPQQ